MADYINIYGQDILAVASDPANPTQGQIWYNTTSNTLKGLGYQAAAWATGTAQSQARYYGGGAGIQTAALSTGGYDTTWISATEEYDGSSWTSGGSLATARYGLGSFGVQTAAVVYAGNAPSGDPSATEEYDGTSWSGGGTFPSTGAIFNGTGAGTLTAGLAAGLSPSTSSAEYDGTNWTAGGSLTTGRTVGGAAGTQTASFLTGGNAPSASTATEEYDGTSWTAGGTRNQASNNLIAFGTQTAGVATVGEGFSPSAVTETYDGTSWTTSASFNSARYAAASASASPASAGVMFGGNPAPGRTLVEEWTGAAQVIQTITAS
jgi:hypothetical protein